MPLARAHRDPTGRLRRLASRVRRLPPLFLLAVLVAVAAAAVPAVPAAAQEGSPPAESAPPAGEAAAEPGAAAPKTPLQRTLERLTGGGEVAEGEVAAPEPQSGEEIATGEALSQALEEPFEPQTWRDLWERFRVKLVGWLPSLLAAVLVLLVFFVVDRLIQGLLQRVMVRTRADPGVQRIASRLTRYFVLGLGVMMAAGQVGIEVTSLIAGLGIVGLAVGLAAQDSLANLIAGLTILWDRPFRIGDNVTVAGTFGEVKEIGLRSTRIRTVEQLDAILPNKEIINQKIVNHTLNPMLRLGIPLAIAYKEDTRRAREVLLRAVADHDLILAKPEPKVVVTMLADSSVNLELRVWLRDAHGERAATFEMIELAKIALDEAGIEIPFPQRTVHVSGLPLVATGESEPEEPR